LYLHGPDYSYTQYFSTDLLSGVLDYKVTECSGTFYIMTNTLTSKFILVELVMPTGWYRITT